MKLHRGTEVCKQSILPARHLRRVRPFCTQALKSRPHSHEFLLHEKTLARRIVHAMRAQLQPESKGDFPVLWLPKFASLVASGLILCGGGSALAAEKGSIIVGPPRVVDGDTLVVGGEKIRLYGLDAPESKQSCNNSRGQAYACGKVSGDALREKIGKAAVQCEVKAKDLYGRNVATCSSPDFGDLGDWLVKNGHAVAYREYAKVYVDDETAAKSGHKGIWDGSFQTPSEWRKDQKSNKSSSSNGTPDSPTDADFGSVFSNVATFFQGSGSGDSGPGRSSPSGDCQIKGNISGKGEKIYHVPGGRYFAGVKIEPQKGEAFFCSENDAQSAGFRKSRE